MTEGHLPDLCREVAFMTLNEWQVRGNALGATKDRDRGAKLTKSIGQAIYRARIARLAFVTSETGS